MEIAPGQKIVLTIELVPSNQPAQAPSGGQVFEMPVGQPAVQQPAQPAPSPQPFRSPGRNDVAPNNPLQTFDETHRPQPLSKESTDITGDLLKALEQKQLEINQLIEQHAGNIPQPSGNGEAEPGPQHDLASYQKFDSRTYVEVDQTFAYWVIEQVWPHVAQRAQAQGVAPEIVIVGTQTAEIAVAITHLVRGNGRICCVGDCTTQAGQPKPDKMEICGEDYKQTIFFAKAPTNDGEYGNPVTDLPDVWQSAVDLLIFTVAGPGAEVMQGLRKWCGKLRDGSGIVLGNSFNEDAHEASVGVLKDLFVDSLAVDPPRWWYNAATSPPPQAQSVREKKPVVITRPSPGRAPSDTFVTTRPKKWGM